jgi:hypothetical protein
MKEQQFSVQGFMGIEQSEESIRQREVYRPDSSSPPLDVWFSVEGKIILLWPSDSVKKDSLTSFNALIVQTAGCTGS